jgi:hypothetical protein
MHIDKGYPQTCLTDRLSIGKVTTYSTAYVNRRRPPSPVTIPSLSAVPYSTCLPTDMYVAATSATSRLPAKR